MSLLVIGGSTLVSQVMLSDDYNSITTVRFLPRKHEVHLSLSGCLNRSDAARREKYLKSAPILEGETQELSHGVNGNIAVSGGEIALGNGGNFVNIAPPQLRKKRSLFAHHLAGKFIFAISVL